MTFLGPLPIADVTEETQLGLASELMIPCANCNKINIIKTSDLVCGVLWRMMSTPELLLVAYMQE